MPKSMVVAVNSFNKIRKEKTTDFYRVETWDKLAELARVYLTKGNQVSVAGRLVMDKWVDKDGRDRITPTVQASQLALPPRGSRIHDEGYAGDGSSSEEPLAPIADDETDLDYGGKDQDKVKEDEEHELLVGSKEVLLEADTPIKGSRAGKGARTAKIA